MTIQPGANLYTQGFGSRPEGVEVPHFDVRDPATNDVNFPQGKRWINTISNDEWVLTTFSASAGSVTANWTVLGGGAVAVATLTGDTGTATPSAGNIKIAGTTNEITTAASGSTLTLSLPAAITTPGSLTVSTKLSVTTGANASAGQSAAMTAGTITISTTAVTASSLIFLTNALPGGTVGTLSVGTITDGTSFVINSSSATDTSKVNWWIIN